MKRNEMRSRISEIFINCELDAAWFVRSIEKHILAAKRVQSSRRKCQSRNCIVIHRVERMAQWHTSQWRTYHFYVLRKTQENRKTKQNRKPQQKQCTIQKSEMYSLLFFFIWIYLFVHRVPCSCGRTVLYSTIFARYNSHSCRHYMGRWIRIWIYIHTK